MRKKHIALTFGLVCTALGFGIPFWLFIVVGIFSCTIAYPLLGVLIGVFADMVFGTPPGVLHFILFPFSLLGFLLALFSVFIASRIRSRNLY